jgi:hypothetical protein
MAAAGIANVFLPGNVFRTVVRSTFANQLPPKLRLDLSHCHFLASRLADFLKCFESHDGISLDLSLAAAGFSGESWSDFITGIDLLTLPTLTSLNWDLNRITPAVLAFFARAPRLRSLSISDCIGTADVDLLAPLSAIAPKLRLRALSWRSSCRETRLGPAIVDAALAFCDGGLRALDIRGQAIGADGLTRIARRLPGDFECFQFDGCGVPDAVRLLPVLRELARRPGVAAWPAADADAAIAGADERTEMAALRAAFRGGADGNGDAVPEALPDDAKIHVFKKGSPVGTDPIELLCRELEQETSVDFLKALAEAG